jgi:hypothetical protein
MVFLRRTADVARKNLVAQGKSALGNEQAHHHLGLLVHVVLGEPRHPKFVRFEALEVQGGHIIQYQVQPVLQGVLGVGYGEFLHLLFAFQHRLQPTVERTTRVPNTEVRFEQCQRPQLTGGFHQADDGKVQQETVPDGVKAALLGHLAKGGIGQAVQGTKKLGALGDQRCITAMSMEKGVLSGVLGIPLLRSANENFDPRFIMRATDVLEDLYPLVRIAYNLHGCSAGAGFCLAYGGQNIP